MRVGFYIANTKPESGGAYSLLKTIEGEINALDIVNYEVFIFFNDSSVKEGPKGNRITYINLYYKSTICFKVKRKILLFLGKYKDYFSIDHVLHKNRIDLLWILGPYDIEVTIPYVFTVWDLGHRMIPVFPEVSTEGWKWDDRENLYQKMLYRAAFIITGNEAGKQEILNNYPVNAEKIKIIPFPATSFCFEKIESSPGNYITTIKSPFIFYPAQFWPHKNHVSLIESIVFLRDTKGVIMNCYFVGSDQGNTNYIKKLIDKYHLENQVFILGFVDLATLVYLYRNALAMTYVSLMGPNNLPPLEAAILGCPLIFSNIPGHLEQMEKTGIAVDARNPVDIGEAIFSIYNDVELRQKLISKELLLAEKYKKYSYFAEMLKIIDDFVLYRKTWEW